MLSPNPQNEIYSVRRNRKERDIKNSDETPWKKPFKWGQTTSVETCSDMYRSMGYRVYEKHRFHEVALAVPYIESLPVTYQ